MVRVRYFVEGFVVRLVSFKGLVFLFLLAGLAPGSARPDAPDKVASALLFLQGHIKAWGLVCQVMATGSEPLGEYQRKTQSPVVWWACC